MTYRVLLTSPFRDEFERVVDHLSSRGVGFETLDGWSRRVLRKVATLEEVPICHAVDDVYARLVNRTVRKLNSGHYKI